MHHADLADKLLATGDAYLEEGNTWHDEIWGVYQGEGTNWLGLILMQVREELRMPGNSACARRMIHGLYRSRTLHENLWGNREFRASAARNPARLPQKDPRWMK